MEAGDAATTTTFRHPLSSSPSSSPASSPHLPPASPPVVLSPCAACKILRRRCTEKCVLAPYFPPNEPLKFATAHRVFGASNIIKFLQELPESQRSDAVSSMAYEANARIRDPVYGCAGIICQLQKQVSELQTQLARTQAELDTTKTQYANLVAIICMEMTQSQQQFVRQPPHSFNTNNPNLFQSDASMQDDYFQGSIWEEPLWT
ncbi:LOB domain-containing protein 1-like [Phoenix dactylifera]|uniref:LOB domain-containing protein 1-like n=1 Tax=Phoenix dactylifera TaxID=42345 RepID=A0A8B7BRC1_PHODC|nr:LOB domain-containing protein 1-like [Phoenix dactylifera]